MGLISFYWVLISKSQGTSKIQFCKRFRQKQTAKTSCVHLATHNKHAQLYCSWLPNSPGPKFSPAMNLCRPMRVNRLRSKIWSHWCSDLFFLITVMIFFYVIFFFNQLRKWDMQIKMIFHFCSGKARTSADVILLFFSSIPRFPELWAIFKKQPSIT